MSGFRLLSLPQLWFAHTYRAESYRAQLPKRDGMIEITAVTAGCLELCQNGERYRAERGDILVNFRETDLLVNADAPHTHHTVAFRMEREACEVGDIPRFSTRIRAQGRFDVCLHLIDEIIDCSTLYAEDRMRSTGLFLQLLSELGRIQSLEHAACTPGEAHYVARAKRYVGDHIREPIQQKEIAAFLGISPEYLCAVFKKCERVSLLRFINGVKLAGVCAMMENNGATLAQASRHYGYSDPNYVSRLYKKYYQKSITQAVKAAK